MNGLITAAGGANPLHGEIASYALRCPVVAAAPADAQRLRGFAAALMTAIASACIGAGAKDVSHVKGYLEHASGFLHADVVGDPQAPRVEGRDGGPATSFTLAVNSVIYGLDAAAVARSTETALEATLDAFGFARDAATR